MVAYCLIIYNVDTVYFLNIMKHFYLCCLKFDIIIIIIMFWGVRGTVSNCMDYGVSIRYKR